MKSFLLHLFLSFTVLVQGVSFSAPRNSIPVSDFNGYQANSNQHKLAPVSAFETIGRLLIVEDNEDLLSDVKRLFRGNREIAEITTAGSFGEGLTQLSQHRGINILVLDYLLSGDMRGETGVVLCKRAFSEYRFRGRVVIYSVDSPLVKSVIEQDEDLKKD